MRRERVINVHDEMPLLGKLAKIGEFADIAAAKCPRAAVNVDESQSAAGGVGWGLQDVGV